MYESMESVRHGHRAIREGPEQQKFYCGLVIVSDRDSFDCGTCPEAIYKVRKNKETSGAIRRVGAVPRPATVERTCCRRHVDDEFDDPSKSGAHRLRIELAPMSAAQFMVAIYVRPTPARFNPFAAHRGHAKER